MLLVSILLLAILSPQPISLGRNQFCLYSLLPVPSLQLQFRYINRENELARSQWEAELCLGSLGHLLQSEAFLPAAQSQGLGVGDDADLHGLPTRSSYHTGLQF